MDDLNIMGNSSDALLNHTEDNTDLQNERNLELMREYFAAISNGDDIAPIIIARQDGRMFVSKLNVDENGNLELPKLQVLTKQDLKVKRALVSRIIKKLQPELLASIGNVTTIALMRKDTDKLQDIVDNFNMFKSEKLRIENRLGCIWVVIGPYEFVI